MVVVREEEDDEAMVEELKAQEDEYGREGVIRKKKLPVVTQAETSVAPYQPPAK